jgi:hypothetical protein
VGNANLIPIADEASAALARVLEGIAKAT